MWLEELSGGQGVAREGLGGGNRGVVLREGLGGGDRGVVKGGARWRGQGCG